MGKQHQLIINRMLANYLLKEFETDSDGGPIGDDINSVCGLIGLCDEDIAGIQEAAKRRIKQLEKASEPLGNRAANWPSEIANA